MPRTLLLAFHVISLPNTNPGSRHADARPTHAQAFPSTKPRKVQSARKNISGSLKSGPKCVTLPRSGLCNCPDGGIIPSAVVNPRVRFRRISQRGDSSVFFYPYLVDLSLNIRFIQDLESPLLVRAPVAYPLPLYPGGGKGRGRYDLSDHITS